MLDAEELAVAGSGHVVDDVARIVMVGYVEDCPAQPHLVIAEPGNEREAEILGHLQIERGESRQALAVGNRHAGCTG